MNKSTIKRILLITLICLLTIGSVSAQMVLRDDFSGANTVTPYLPAAGGTAWWRSGAGDNGALQRYNGYLRPLPNVTNGATAPNDSVVGITRSATFDTLGNGNFQVQLTLNNATANSSIDFYFSQTKNFLFNGCHGYMIKFVKSASGLDNLYIFKTDSMQTFGPTDLNWASGSHTHLISWNIGHTLTIQIRKDTKNIIAFSIDNGSPIDSILNTVAGDMKYFSIRMGTGRNTQLDNFYFGPYVYTPPGPTPPDLNKPIVTAYTIFPTSNIDSTKPVTITYSATDDSVLARGSMWVTGWNTLTDTVLVTDVPLTGQGATITSPAKALRKGMHYSWATFRDGHGNVATSSVNSFKVDTIVAVVTPPPAKFWVAGYYPGWANTPRPGQLDWSVWTHIIHFCIDPTTTRMPDPSHPEQLYFNIQNGRDVFENGANQGGYPVQRQLIDTAHAHGRKVLLCLGGAGGSYIYWEQLYNINPETLKVCLTSQIAYARSRGYDGVDIDWEWPGSTQEGIIWNYFIKTIRDILNTWPQRGLLTTAQFQWVAQLSPNIDYALMNSAIDQWNIMAYDMERGSRNVAHAPLTPTDCNLLPPGIGYGTKGDNVQELVHQYILKGVNPAIIGVGLPFYGYQHNGSSQFCVASGGGSQIQYFNIYPLYQGANANRYVWDAATQTPYLSYGTTFISFDDSNSLAAKTAWAKSAGLGGMMVWEMDQDVNVNGKYILTNGIKNGLGGSVTPPPVTNLVNVVSNMATDTVGKQMTFTASSNYTVDSLQWYRSAKGTAGVYVFTATTTPHTLFWTPKQSGIWTTYAVGYKGGVQTKSNSLDITVYDSTIIVVPPPVIVNCDTAFVRGVKMGYDSGYTKGQASVVCPPPVVCPPFPDTTAMKLKAVAAGYSVGYDSGYSKGFTAGKTSVVCPPPTICPPILNADSIARYWWNAALDAIADSVKTPEYLKVIKPPKK